MECPFCKAELDAHDSFGNKEYIVFGDSKGKRGDIFKCPNSDGFEDLSQAMEYLKEIGETLDSLGIESFEDLEGCINDHGNSYYYNYVRDESELHDGYPC